MLPQGQAQTIYSQSKVINNIVVGNNNTIMNNGIGYDRSAAASREEIRKVVVRDPPTIGGKAACEIVTQFSSGMASAWGTPMPDLPIEPSAIASAGMSGSSSK